ncbi:MAG: MoaD/ThiS family protein [Hyphomicrobium sp.]|nr:MoaD/ThiS family protein [Hyphomicrobium sp.]
MVRVVFTPSLQRHIACSPREVEGRTVREALEVAFSGDARARSYVLDDQAALRKHMSIFINGTRIRDRVRLSDAVPDDAEIYNLQALSGG